MFDVTKLDSPSADRFRAIDKAVDSVEQRNRVAVSKYLHAVLWGYLKRNENPVLRDMYLEDAKDALAEFKAINRRPEVGEYLIEQCYSDVKPWEIIAVNKSGKTVEVRSMNAELDTVNGPKPEFIPGGFSAICTNMDKLVYKIEPDPEGSTRKVRFSGAGWDKGRMSLSDKPVYHYDYNF